MRPCFTTPQITLYQGSSLQVMRQLPAESVDCCVTSPPYYGLRDYGSQAQIWGGSADCSHDWQRQDYYREGGNSASSRQAFTQPGEDNAKRVKETRWKTNVTCTHCGAWQGEFGQEPTLQMYVQHMTEIFAEVHRLLKPGGTCWLNLGDSYACSSTGSNTTKSGLMGGKATQEVAGDRPSKLVDGLKPKDLMMVPHRCAIALQDAGWWVRSDIVWAKGNPMPESVTDRPTRSHEYIFLLTKNERYYYNAEAIKEPAVSSHPSGNGYRRDERLSYLNPDGSARGNDKPWQVVESRNKRSVWHINTQPFPEAHFAVFPPELPRLCIAAGCPDQGTVLDPFAGSGTTLKTAQELGRKAIGIELNPNYCKLIEHRCRQLTIFDALSLGA